MVNNLPMHRSPHRQVCSTAYQQSRVPRTRPCSQQLCLHLPMEVYSMCSLASRFVNQAYMGLCCTYLHNCNQLLKQFKSDISAAALSVPNLYGCSRSPRLGPVSHYDWNHRPQSAVDRGNQLVQFNPYACLQLSPLVCPVCCND